MLYKNKKERNVKMLEDPLYELIKEVTLNDEERKQLELDVYKLYDGLEGEKRKEAFKLLDLDYDPSDLELIDIYFQLVKIKTWKPCPKFDDVVKMLDDMI